MFTGAMKELGAIGKAERCSTAGAPERRGAMKTCTARIVAALAPSAARRTPSVAADEWVSYQAPGFVDHVVFVGGKIQSITRAPAP